jgi:tetrahydromethanopterin S-methyltransferase subunit A
VRGRKRPFLRNVSATEIQAFREQVHLIDMVPTAPQITAAEPTEVVVLDKAGYFVIMPLPDKDIIYVEQYAYDNVLLRVIEGANARAVYHMIIDGGWVTELSHAAYSGKELVKAELSMQYGFKYVQDGA